MATSARSAAAIDAGLALYESSMTVTPSGRSKTSIRRSEASRSPVKASATSAGDSPSRSATAAASSELPTWCRPAAASRTGVALPW